MHVRPGDRRGCESFVAELERYASAVRAAFPSSRVGSERTEIYQFASVADFEASGACAPIPQLEGCAHDKVAFTTPGATEHELAHTLFRPAGLPPPLFGEGAAVAVSCHTNPELMLAFAARDWRAYLADDTRNGWASRWATYLRDEYGPDAFLELYGALPHDATEETVEREFRRIYSEDIDDVWARMLAGSTIRSCMALQACDGEALSEEPAALGRGCGQRLGAPLPDSAGAVEVSISGQGWGLVSCTASGYAAEVADYAEPSFWFSSSETHYSILDYRRAYDPDAAPIYVSARPLPGVMVNSCSDTRAVELEAGARFARRALVGPSGGPLYVEFHAPRPFRLYPLPLATTSDAALFDVCRGCEAGVAVDCEWSSGASEGRRWLRIRANELSPGDFLDVALHVEVDE